jgi:pimeloyl-ACP methyl ester carboxylesterase
MDQDTSRAVVPGHEHWTKKGDVKLFLWEKAAQGAGAARAVRARFVDGFAADVRSYGARSPDSSAMDWFAQRGFDTWSRRHGRLWPLDKQRGISSNIADGADDLAAATDYIMKTRGVKQFLVYGISSGALRAALFAQRHPERVARLALDAFVWTGKGSPTLAERTKKLPEFQENEAAARSIAAFVYSIFERGPSGLAPKKR